MEVIELVNAVAVKTFNRRCDRHKRQAYLTLPRSTTRSPFARGLSYQLKRVKRSTTDSCPPCRFHVDNNAVRTRLIIRTRNRPRC